MVRVLILFYSAYGHIYKMAKAIAEGVEQVEEAEAILRRVPETLPAQLVKQLGLDKSQKAFSNTPICTIEELEDYDAIIIGTPTRYGNMCAQMRAFLDGTGPLWAKGALVGKVGSVFTSSGTQHGGQETTIISTMITLLHHGMVLVGLPYSFQGQSSMDEITGCSPYGASTIAGGQGQRTPSENELDGARYQGEFVAKIASKLAK